VTTATTTPGSVGTDRELRYREAINEALRQEMERDPTVIIMGEEIAGGAGREDLGIVDAWGGPFKTTVGLIQQFGAERVRDTPLSEAGFVGTAIGAASTGLRPIAELMFVDFIGVCLDQILNNAAKMRYMYGGQVKVPFTLLTRIGAGTGSAAQHSESFYSIFSHIPGIKGVVPCDPYTAKGLLTSAIRDDDPVVVFEHKLLYPETGPVPEEPYAIPLGKARIVKPGKDITLLGISRMTLLCLEAAQTLAKEGVDAEVVDLMSISPIDYDLIVDSVRRTHRIVVVDEDTPRCSVAADICSAVAEEAFDYLDAPPTKVTAPHTPVPYSRPLEGVYVPDTPRILSAVKRVLNSA
jgi:pyruvate dehydrogenase E1 component beta subunit